MSEMIGKNSTMKVSEALNVASDAGFSVTRNTMCRWCRSRTKGGLGIGIKIGRDWRVYRALLMEVLEGKRNFGQEKNHDYY